jgi:dephospho-CoA kinase
VKIIGITGGIGSGKSTICRVFRTWGVPVFDADTVARSAYMDPIIMQNVIALLGPDAYRNEKPDFAFISSIVFGNPEKLQSLESIIHPWVSDAFQKWISIQRTPYVIREAAILIESGAYKDCSEVVAVVAPVELRLKWVKARNNWSEAQIKERMSRQLSDEERSHYATRLLINNNEKLLTPVLWDWHQEWSV